MEPSESDGIAAAIAAILPAGSDTASLGGDSQQSSVTRQSVVPLGKAKRGSKATRQSYAATTGTEVLKATQMFLNDPEIQGKLTKLRQPSVMRSNTNNNNSNAGGPGGAGFGSDRAGAVVADQPACPSRAIGGAVVGRRRGGVGGTTRAGYGASDPAPGGRFPRAPNPPYDLPDCRFRHACPALRHGVASPAAALRWRGAPGRIRPGGGF